MPAIFHITHVENLAGIIADGCLWSDRRLLRERGPQVIIGFDKIKRRRLEQIEVTCHPGTKVGDYVPFYFCPRSVMLYVIDRRHRDLQYRGGQRETVHLASTVEDAIATAGDRQWAYSDGNAGALYTDFCNDLDRMDEFIDWQCVRARYWADPGVKESKQAEFLVHESFPWTGIREIGVHDEEIAARAREILACATHQPQVTRRPNWYYRIWLRLELRERRCFAQSAATSWTPMFRRS